MSIQTLKKLTAAKYNNNSVGLKHFSLNGVTRNQGYIGQGVRGRTIIGTKYKGNTPCGSGGCCGTYRISLVQPQVWSTENPSCIKPSVLSNYGSIKTHYKWIWRPYPFTSVKPDGNANLLGNSSGGSYIKQLQLQTIYDINNCTFTKNLAGLGTHNPAICNLPYFRSSYPNPTNPLGNIQNPITKQVGPIDQSMYILQLDNACSQITEFYVPNNLQNTPLPGSF